MSAVLVALLLFAACAQMQVPADDAPRASAETEKVVASGEKAVRDRPDDARAYVGLGYAYLQKIRETADTSLYATILDLMERAKKLDPANGAVFGVIASVQAGKHHFAEALVAGTQAVKLAPDTAHNYAPVVDADVELGKYEDAATALQAMVDRRPDFSSYSRVSYLRELYGDLPGAISAMQSALSAGSAVKENVAWAKVELGKLREPTDLAAADRLYDEALNILPLFPRALEGKGRIAVVKGDFAAAKSFYSQAFNALPIAEYATDIGDVARRTGDTATAERYYAIVEETYANSQSSGIKIDLEYALFLAERGLLPDEAARRAQIAYAERPNIIAADTLAWVLHGQGKEAEAAKLSAEALRLGAKIPMLHFHAAMIALAQQDKARAKTELEAALSANPHFSILHEEEARATLKTL